MKRDRGHMPPGQVRIIGGSLRGSKLAVPAIDGLRPTPQRLRETLFNWLAPVIEGARVLDLFAGSGALGIEALSRGSANALLIECDRAQAAAIAADLARLRMANGEACCADAQAMLAESPSQPFDIVFLDPPFDAALWTPVAALLDAHGWLSPGACIYMESAAGTVFEVPARWTLYRQTRTGAVVGALYRLI